MVWFLVDVVMIAGLFVAFLGAAVGALWSLARGVVALAEAMHQTPDLDAIHGREEAIDLPDSPEARQWLRGYLPWIDPPP